MPRTLTLPMLAAVAEQQPSALRAVSERKEFQPAVIAYAHSRYWLVWWTHDSRHSPDGEPDLRMVNRLQRRFLGLELKAEKGRLTDAQRTALEWLTAAGFEAGCFRPSDARRLMRILDGEERL
jgi:hypothetical protein